MPGICTSATTHVQSCKWGNCRNSSAEVITEDPGNSAPSVNLADYGMVNVTGVGVTSGNGTKGTLNAMLASLERARVAGLPQDASTF